MHIHDINPQHTQRHLLINVSTARRHPSQPIVFNISENQLLLPPVYSILVIHSQVDVLVKICQVVEVECEVGSEAAEVGGVQASGWDRESKGGLQEI